jgi:hypothetical protein
MLIMMAMMLLALQSAAVLLAPPSLAATTPSWSVPQCALSGGPVAAVWFADVGTKVFLGDDAPAVACGAALRLSAARGEHATFQVAVRPSRDGRALTGVGFHLDGGPAGVPLDVRRAAFTNVTTAANNVSSAGTGMYPDPLPYPNDTIIFPQGGDTVQPGTTAVFWLTLGPIPANLARAGLHTMQLTVSGTGMKPHPIVLRVWDFTLPDAGHASQWTEADPFGALQSCNIIDEVRRPMGCSSNRSGFPHGPEQPCLTTETVDSYYREMAAHRINRVAWMNSWDFATGVGLTISNDTQSVTLDTAAFDANIEKLLALGYRDIKLPIPACQNGGSCSFNSAGSVSPDAQWTFANSTMFNSSTGRGWHGNCESPSSGCVMGWAHKLYLTVPMFDNASLNAPSATNSSEKAYMTQAVGDSVVLNPEFERLFKLVMTPMTQHLRAKGWINRTFAYISDETRWPCYSGTVSTPTACCPCFLRSVCAHVCRRARNHASLDDPPSRSLQLLAVGRTSL